MTPYGHIARGFLLAAFEAKGIENSLYPLLTQCRAHKGFYFGLGSSIVPFSFIEFEFAAGLVELELLITTAIEIVNIGVGIGGFDFELDLSVLFNDTVHLIVYFDRNKICRTN